MYSLSRWKTRMTACILSGVVAFGTLFPVPAEAAGKTAVYDGREIVDLAGNSEMKAYGERLVTGGKASVSRDYGGEAGAGISYYLDSESGNDENEGTSEDKPWKSLKMVNNRTFQPGDRILLKAGSVWKEETLSPKGSGEEGNPIVIGAYGDGDKPKLEGNAAVPEVVSLYNQQYWEISDLEITNTAAGFTGAMNDQNGNKLKDVRGIRIAGQDGGDLNNFYLHDLHVHDVTGVCAWISGDSNGKPGILGKQGWDKSKRTGGIVFEVMEPATDQPTVFHDITVERNVVNNNSFGGIIIKQWKGADTGGEHWASREEGKGNAANNYFCENWKPHTDVTIRDNYLSQENSDYACNTIYLTSVQGAVVEGNISKEAGTCGIEMYYADDVTVQRNEVYKTRVKAGGADSNAIDPDKASTNILIQYNYIHDTGDGILLCGFIFGTSVVRYNVIKDAQKRYINPHGDKGVNYVYNNILYNTIEKSNLPFIESSGGNSVYLNKSGNMHYFNNNIFYNTAKTTTSVGIGEGTSTSYDSNCYYGKGVQAPEQETHAVCGDPMFEGELTGSGEEGPEELLKLRLKTESPLLNAGIEVEDDPLLSVSANPGTDFAGDPVFNGEPDMGIFEYQGEAGSGILNGYVEDPYGNIMKGASVKLKDTDYAAVTNEQGFFAIAGVKPGSYTAVISKEIYLDGETPDITVEEKAVTRVQLKLGESLSDVGSVKGCVSNSSGPLQGVTVTVSLEDQVYTVKTRNDGCYEIPDVKIGTGYEVTASKEGYKTATEKDVRIMPAAVSEVNLILSREVGKTTYLIADLFDQYDTGAFTNNSRGNELWKVSDISAADSAKASLQIKAEANGNKYLEMAKNGSYNLYAYTKKEYDLNGIITVEARVKRTKETASPNQFGMYSFNKADFKTGDPTSSSNAIGTFALSKGNIITHNKKGSSSTVNVQPYEKGRWDIIRNVINLDTNTFDFYVNDMNVPKLADQPLRTQGKNIDRFEFFSSSTNGGDLLIDYFKVCTGPAMDYNDAGLSGISVDGKEAEWKGENIYEMQIPSGSSEVKVQPSANSIFVKKVMVGGKDATKEAVSVPVPEAGEPLLITVLAEDGETEERYQLNLVKEDVSGLAYLTNLTIEGITLTPEFDFNTMEYEGNVPSDVHSVTLQYETVQASNEVTVKVNNQEVTDRVIPLKPGVNVIEIGIASADGTSFADYTVTVTRDCVIDEIQIDTLPVKTVYERGEEPDFEGLTVGAYCEGDRVRSLEAAEFTVSMPDTSKAGTVSVTVTYETEDGKTLEASFDITVYDRDTMQPQSIKVVKQPEQTVYGTGEAFNPDGMEVRLLMKATASNAAPAEVRILDDGEYDVMDDFTEPGDTMVTIRYSWTDSNGEERYLEDQVAVTVYDEELEYYQTGIKVTKQPKKTVYETGSIFDPDGMEVKRIMKASGSNADYYQETITDYDYETAELTGTGSRKIAIRHEGTDENGDEQTFKAVVTVTVTNREDVLNNAVLKQSVAEAGEKLNKEYVAYMTDEEKDSAANAAKNVFLDVMGAEHTVLTKDMADRMAELEALLKNAYPDITVRIEGDSSLTEGAKVTGTLLNAPFGQGNVRMVPQITKTKLPEDIPQTKAATAMEIKLLANGEELQPDIPLYLTLKIPEGLDRKDLIVYCELDDGSIKAVNPEISGEFLHFFVRSAGTFVIANPKENDLTEIEITAKPKKTEYRINESFDAAGLVVTAVYEDGTRTVVTGYEMAGFDSTVAGTKTITVFYQGKTAEFTVMVKADEDGPDDDDKDDDHDKDDDYNSDHGSHGSSGGSSAVRTVLPDTVKGNWRQDENGWWFETTDGGYVVSDWARINEKWYYFNEQGYMAAGWVLDQNHWYYLGEDGVMADYTWILDRGTWYFLQSGGVMAADQWVLWNGNWYYLSSDGSMARDTVITVGYRIDEDGVWRPN
ncbi:Cna B domain-containing protein [Hungatella hathewayi]|nr:Cna B domain-containing protein [Hungatella hathewayi]